MNKKVIFLDVDGTLVGFKDGKQIVPESAKQAIQKARTMDILCIYVLEEAMRN